MKIETKLQLEQRVKNNARRRITDRINEKMEIHIKHFKKKNNTKNAKDTNKLHTSNQGRYNNLQRHVFNNDTQFKTNPQYFTNTKIEELTEFKYSSDYEAIWKIAIDKWTRNWNFYREHLRDTILEKFGKNNK